MERLEYLQRRLSEIVNERGDAARHEAQSNFIHERQQYERTIDFLNHEEKLLQKELEDIYESRQASGRIGRNGRPAKTERAYAV